MVKKLFLFVGTLLTLPLLATTALAHEHQVFKIGGAEYEFTIGSLSEPVFVDDKTGVELRVNQITAGPNGIQSSTPATGLEQTLKVELIAGEQKKTFDLSPAFRDPGAYRAPFYPTVATTYSYRVFGTIASVPVDLTFACNPAGHPPSEEDTNAVEVSEGVTRVLKSGAFGCPRPRADANFPEAAESLRDLSKQADGLESALADLGATSKNFTFLGVALGLLGVVLGVVALVRKRSTS